MASEAPFVLEKLANGLTVVIEVMPHVRSAACGILVRAGSRDEPPELAGVSHFLEHLCFKGTANRTAEELNVAFDEIGADNNAYTTRDQTFYYSWAQTEHVDRQIELLADMMRPALPPDAFELERQVVLEEIAMYKDDLVSRAADFLYEQAFADSPLAWPIIGREETVSAMTREQVRAYLDRRYAPQHLVLAVAGDVRPEQVMQFARRWCGGWEPAPADDAPRIAPTIRTGVAVLPLERFYQQAVVLAFASPTVTHLLDETAEVIAAILGGHNSRFYWNVIQRGISPRAGVFREEYQDCGVVGMYGLCEPDNADRLLAAMRRQAEELTADGPDPKEVTRMRNLRRTSLAAEAESPYHRVGQLADDVDYRGAPRSAEERLAAVDAVDADTIAACLREYPMTGDGLLVSVGPRRWPVQD